ncbi:hypothetical protein QTP86_011263 [Hemibagrus guttatus]|nr:hypothetical protein QTP86_011263 [Hemibagrus guttatus]
MLQTISTDLLPFITTVINASLTSGHVPTAFKKARVIPIPKKPALDPSDISNYRPVSLLSFLSKILERIVYNQLSDYLLQNNLHDPNQSGFKAAHSTETALLAVTEQLHAARSAKLSLVLILLNLSAAFGTVNHKTLLSTLRSLGICGTAWSRGACAYLRRHWASRQDTPWTECQPITGNTHTHSLTTDNLETPINLPRMSLDWGRKPEHPEETPEAQGEHANSTRRNRTPNPGGSWYVVGYGGPEESWDLVGYGSPIGSWYVVGYGGPEGGWDLVGYGSSIGSCYVVGYGGPVGSWDMVGHGEPEGYGGPIGCWDVVGYGGPKECWDVLEYGRPEGCWDIGDQYELGYLISFLFLI